MLNNNIKAAVLDRVRSKLKIIENISIPDLKKGQVLVKINYTGVCRSQLYEVQGKRGKDLYLPHMLGHEATGIVVSCGKGVKKIKPKDKVFLTWIKSKGIEAPTAKFKYPNKNKKINSGRVTTFSNFSIVSENRVVKLPKGINTKIGVLLGCALPTGAGMILNQTNINRNSKVIIFGLGGVGLSALLAATMYKPKTLVGLDKNKFKINYLKKFFKKKIKLLSKIKNLNDFDYAIETSGSVKGIEKCISLLNEKGKCVFASHPPKNERIKLDPFDLIKGKKIEGSWGGKVNFDKHLKSLVRILLSNKKVKELFFKKEYKLNNINDALLDLKKGKIQRALIKV